MARKAGWKGPRGHCQEARPRPVRVPPAPVQTVPCGPRPGFCTASGHACSSRVTKPPSSPSCGRPGCHIHFTSHIIPSCRMTGSRAACLPTRGQHPHGQCRRRSPAGQPPCPRAGPDDGLQQCVSLAVGGLGRDRWGRSRPRASASPGETALPSHVPELRPLCPP